ncbi:vacuolar protein sorting-associated protein 62 [Trichoderma evansii]
MSHFAEIFTISTTSFNARWSDQYSRAARNGSFWHPVPQESPMRRMYKPLGSVGVSHFNDINGNYEAQLFAVGNIDHGLSPLAPPVGYTQIWTDKQSGAKQDGAIRRPFPLTPYVALGDVVGSDSSTPPSIDDVWRVLASYIEQASFGSSSIWDSKESRSLANVSIWGIQEPARADAADSENAATLLGPIRASQNYDAPALNFAEVIKNKNIMKAPELN